MKKCVLSYCLFIFALVAFGEAWAVGAKSTDYAQVKAIFAKPDRQYSTGPLWVWNDMLTNDEVVSTLRDLASQNVRQVFVHPRAGLMTPYLSKEWFRLWKLALQEAKKLDMNIWIYDEYSFPSGFAGGLVPEAMPESRTKGLSISEVNSINKIEEDTLAIFCLSNTGFENITSKARAGEQLPESKYLVVKLVPDAISAWYGGKFYVDFMKPGVTEKFLEITMDAYKREFGSEFGKRIPGVFTDEAHFEPAGMPHWSDDLESVFKKRWGYSLIDNLPSLFKPVGDWKKVRHNYYQVLLEQFIARWSKPYYEYCEKNKLEFTGHYGDHDWPNAVHTQDNMALNAWQHRPGCDILFNQYSEQTIATSPLGYDWYVKEYFGAAPCGGNTGYCLAGYVSQGASDRPAARQRISYNRLWTFRTICPKAARRKIKIWVRK